MRKEITRTNIDYNKHEAPPLGKKRAIKAYEQSPSREDIQAEIKKIKKDATKRGSNVDYRI